MKHAVQIEVKTPVRSKLPIPFEQQIAGQGRVPLGRGCDSARECAAIMEDRDVRADKLDVLQLAGQSL